MVIRWGFQAGERKSTQKIELARAYSFKLVRTSSSISKAAKFAVVTSVLYQSTRSNGTLDSREFLIASSENASKGVAS